MSSKPIALLNKRIGLWLKSLRVRSNCEIDAAASALGFEAIELTDVEKGNRSIACDEIVRLSEFYGATRKDTCRLERIILGVALNMCLTDQPPPAL